MKRTVGVLFVVVLALAVASPSADAGFWPDNNVPSTAHVVPFYDISAGHASFLILHNPGFTDVVPGGFQGFGAFVTLFFYDQTCAKKADQLVSLTPNDTAVLSVAALNPAAPAQGAILLSATTESDTGGHNGIYVDVLNVDFTNGTATLLNSIITLKTFSNTVTTTDWALYSPDFSVLTFGPKEAAPISTTLTMSCPRTDAAGTLGGDMDAITEDDFFSPAAGTRTTVLDIFVFDLDEKFLGSIHNVTCRCFERKALKDWVPQALTSDVAVYFHGVQDNDATLDRSTAGFYETVVNLGTTKFYWSSYLKHGPRL